MEVDPSDDASKTAVRMFLADRARKGLPLFSVNRTHRCEHGKCRYYKHKHVYVCKSSLHVHRCGLHFCNEHVDVNGLRICPISHVELGSTELQLPSKSKQTHG